METQKTIRDKLVHNIQKKLDFYANKGSKSDPILWIGYNLIERMLYLFMISKYNSKCLLYNKNTKYGYLLLNLTNEDMNNYYEISKIIINCIKNKQKRIVIPVNIEMPTLSHANVLIYNNINNTIEHFEPHGAYYQGKHKEGSKIIKKQLKNFIDILNSELKNNQLHTVTLKDSNIVCPNIEGLQLIEKRQPNKIIANNQQETGGYCLMWSSLITDLILKNQNISIEELMYIIFDDILRFKNQAERSIYLKSVIRGFTIYLNEQLEKYFSKMFGQPISFDVLYQNPIKYDKIFNMIIDIELLKLSDPSFNPDERIKLNKDLLKDKNIKLTKFELELIKKKLNILKNIDALKNITITPTTTTQKSSKKSLLSDKQSSIKMSSPKKTRTTKKSSNLKKETNISDNKDIPDKKKRCPNGTRRNKKTGNCEPK